MKKPTSFKDINPLLDDDNVYFMDEPEIYAVVADVSLEDAWKALRLYEENECGFDYDDLEEGVQIDQLEAVVFKETKDGWIYWGNYPEDAKFLSKGWIARI